VSSDLCGKERRRKRSEQGEKAKSERRVEVSRGGEVEKDRTGIKEGANGLFRRKTERTGLETALNHHFLMSALTWI
jgi:hypothetical protein